MGGGARFAPVKQTTAGPGDYYTPPALGEIKASNFNKSANGTMGSSKRFAPIKEAVQGDYSSARPGAFEKSKSGASRANTGFGGTAARVTGPEVISKLSTNLSYDTTSTGAFAKATQAGTTSAAFASRSTQRSAVPVPQGPSATAYNLAAATSGFASRSFNKSLASGTGGFGTSAKRSTDVAGKPPPEDVPGPGEYAPDISDATPRTQKPSAAFASTTSKSVELRPSSGPAPGVDYDAHRDDGMAAVATKTFNKSSASSMGASKRFATNAEVAPGPGEYREQDGAFTKSKSGVQNAGFGGTAARVTVAEEAARAAASNASSHLSYDGASKSTGAFTSAMEVGTTSAAFASKSSQRSALPVPQGPSATSYDLSEATSGFSGKSFNKSLASGTGGFGTSAKRNSFRSNADENVPGPGAYAPDISDDAPREQKPSAAFASTTNKSSHELKGADAPSAFDYDSHKDDGMAAVATKSFNRHVGTGAFGAKAARPMHEKREVLPGAGEYTAADPNKQTMESTAKTAKGKISGAFASTTLRDTSNWATSGSKFLP